MSNSEIILTDDKSGNCKVVIMDGGIEVYFPTSDLDEMIDEVMTSHSFYNWQFTPIEEKSWSVFSSLEIDVRSMLIAYGSFEERIVSDEENGLFKRINDFIKSGAIRLALSATKFDLPKDTIFIDNIDAKLYAHLIARIEMGNFINEKSRIQKRFFDSSSPALIDQ